MRTKLTLAVGAVLTGIGIAYGSAYFISASSTPPNDPQSQPEIVLRSVLPHAPIEAEPPICSLTMVSLSSEWIAERDTTTLTATVVHPSSEPTDESCSSSLVLHALNVDTQPQTPRSVTLPPGRQTSIQWIIRPREAGTFALSVDNSFTESQSTTLKVKTILGLSPQQAEWLTLATGFMGPSLTLAGILDLRDRLKKQNKEDVKLT